MTRTSPDLDVLPFVSTAPRLRWKANHTAGWKEVEGGWAAVRVLVGAIDGGWWPWTAIEHVETERWFQVLGTPASCVLELGLDGAVSMVFRTDYAGEVGWVGMPAECVYWIPAIRSDEVLTADEATAVGRRWLLGQEPWGAWGTRRVYPGPRLV